MIDSIVLLLVCLAVVFMLLTFLWESWVICGIDIILWFITALGFISYEVPYVYISGGVVYEEIQTIETMAPLSGLCMLFGIVMTLYVLYLAIEAWKGKVPKVL